jgi:hypothetical protein
MSKLDTLLVGWWFLVVATLLATWAVRRFSAPPLSAPEALAPASGTGSGPILVGGRVPLGTALLWAALGIPWIAVGIGAVPLMMRQHDSELYVMSIRIWHIVLYAWILRYVWVRPGTGLRVLLGRGLFALLLVPAIILSAYQLLGDMLQERIVVEGRIEQTARGRDHDVYQLFIDGRKYNATAVVFDRVRPGDQVRLKLGAVSEVVFEIEHLRSQ